MPLWEYDRLSRKRISRIMTLQEKRLEYENKMREKQIKEAERKARAAQNNANITSKRGGSQRIPLN